MYFTTLALTARLFISQTMSIHKAKSGQACGGWLCSVEKQRKKTELAVKKLGAGHSLISVISPALVKIVSLLLYC
jgi:hypothetical protein